ncbi:unnamed protein product [Clavelina lepadiformis]|uniref:Uncharacterized protein n=1 Tax=Clavelina lepadiformis TaxID=159417 RepID=A0ABP0FMZ0_CLALP
MVGILFEKDPKSMNKVKRQLYLFEHSDKRQYTVCSRVRDNPHNLITLKNGEKITLSNWQPGFPMTIDPEADRVVMTVQFTDNENKGISNRLPSLDIVVPLCSRAI